MGRSDEALRCSHRSRNLKEKCHAFGNFIDLCVEPCAWRKIKIRNN